MSRFISAIIFGALIAGGLMVTPEFRDKTGLDEKPKPSQFFEVQELLWEEGYNFVEPENSWTEETQFALMAYQHDWGLPLSQDLQSDQELSEELMSRLKREHPDTKPQFSPIEGSTCTAWNQWPQGQETVTWTGKCVDGRASGEGELTWRFSYFGKPVADKYVGDLRAGKAEGDGVHEDGFGARYEGEFRDDNYHGKGTYTDPDGAVYTGHFKEGLPHGQGKLVNWDGMVFPAIGLKVI